MKPLKELNLLEETRGLIGMICLNYWCDTEEEKARFINKLSENEKKYQEELREKYNPDNLFRNDRIQQEENVENEVRNVQMIEYKKEIFITKIIKKIKTFFQKNA